MKFTLPIVIFVVTALLLVVGLAVKTNAGGTVGIAQGSSMLAFRDKSAKPDQALGSFFADIQMCNWDPAFSRGKRASESMSKQDFIQEWMGSNGDLRAFSN